jgi:hypothetical protein
MDVDSSPIVLIQDQKWRSTYNSQRPACRARLDEFGLSVVHFVPIPGAEVLLSGGASLARLALVMDEIYFLYWRRPWTNDFVSFSGLYATSGSRWILGANAGLGFQFPIIGPLQGRLWGAYFLYPTARVPAEVETIALDENVYGSSSDRNLLPEELQPKLAPQEQEFNPSRLQIAFGLAIRF